MFMVVRPILYILNMFQLAVEDLKRHPELQVKFTDSIEVTVVLLSSITADLVERLVVLSCGYCIFLDLATKRNNMQTNWAP